MSLNKVMLIGNVGKDPEVRYLESNPQNPGNNAKVATIRLATSERYRDRNGEQRENTEWHNVVLWRNQADIVEKFVRKGTQLYVEGKLRTRSWTDQTGNKRYTTEVVADTIQLLGRRPDAQSEGGPQPGYAQPGPSRQGYQQGGYGQPGPGYQQGPAYTQPAQAPSAAAPAVDNGPEDDLPF